MPDTPDRDQNVLVPITKLRNLRVDDDLWARAKVIAARRRETLTSVLVRALREYVDRYEDDEGEGT